MESSDMPMANVPRTQHLFSAISDDVIAVVYLAGGYAMTLNFLLKRPGDHASCFYNLGPPVISVSMEGIRQRFAASDHGEVKPSCQPSFLQKASSKPGALRDPFE
jgi:hypothetical protein